MSQSVDFETPSAMDFSGKVVIITGASSGIGAAAAVVFSNQSANLVLVGRNETALNEVAAKCEQAKGNKPLIIKAELTVDEDVKQIVEKTIEKFDRIDVLVNNAGAGFRGSIEDGIEAYDRAMNTNMRPAYLLTSLVVPYLISSKGNVVNVSSVAALKPINKVDLMTYGISKAALDQFTKCLALELGPKGVRVNSVNPGATKTPLLENAGFSNDQMDYLHEICSKNYPLRKIAQSDEVADLILYLASNRARSITGAIYVIDNGDMLM